MGESPENQAARPGRRIIVSLPAGGARAGSVLMDRRRIEQDKDNLLWNRHLFESTRPDQVSPPDRILL
jgi:hypothetical protein